MQILRHREVTAIFRWKKKKKTTVRGGCEKNFSMALQGIFHSSWRVTKKRSDLQRVREAKRSLK